MAGHGRPLSKEGDEGESVLTDLMQLGPNELTAHLMVKLGMDYKSLNGVEDEKTIRHFLLVAYERGRQYGMERMAAMAIAAGLDSDK